MPRAAARVKGLRPRAGHDPAYAERGAQRIAALTKDLSELLPDLVPRLKPRLRNRGPKKLAFHPPCTLQHGQQLRGGVEANLAALGFEVQLAKSESHLCWLGWHLLGAAARALKRLRDRKLEPRAARRRGDRLGQHRLHPAPGQRHGDAGAPLGRGAGRRSTTGRKRWPRTNGQVVAEHLLALRLRP